MARLLWATSANSSGFSSAERVVYENQEPKASLEQAKAEFSQAIKS